MVANITEGTAFDKRGLPFRRRNIRPGVITAAALAVVTALIWMIALTRPAEVHEAAVCNPPPPDAPALGDPVSPSTMASVAPAKLFARDAVRVCASLLASQDRITCLGKVRDRNYAAKDLAACEKKRTVDERLSCLGASGRSAELARAMK